MVKDIKEHKNNIDFLFANINNLNDVEKEVFLYNILEELCKEIKFNGKYCPICGNESDFFLPYGNPPRKNALCPYCYSLERHRFFYLFLKNIINIDKSKTKVLGINLENKISNFLREIPKVKYFDLISDFNNRGLQNPFDEYKPHYFDIIFTTDINSLYKDINKINQIIKADGFLIFAGASDYKFKLSLNRLKKTGFKIKKYSLSDVIDDNNLIDKYSLVDMAVFVARK